MKHINLNQESYLGIALCIAFTTLLLPNYIYFALLVPSSQEIIARQAPDATASSEITTQAHQNPAERVLKRYNYLLPILLAVIFIIVCTLTLFFAHNHFLKGGLLLALCWLTGSAFFYFYPLLNAINSLFGNLLTALLIIGLPVLILFNSRHTEYRKVLIASLISIMTTVALLTIGSITTWLMYLKFRNNFETDQMPIEALRDGVASHVFYVVGGILLVGICILISTFFIHRATLTVAFTYAVFFASSIALVFGHLLTYGFESGISEWLPLYLSLPALIGALLFILGKSTRRDIKS